MKESVGDAKEIEVGKVFRACLAGIAAGKQGECRKYGLGRGTKNSEVPNQL
jgi:hypothetical protein